MAQSEYQSSKEGTIKIPVVAGLDQRSEQGRMNLGNFTEIGSNYQKYQHNLQHLPESFFSQRGTYPFLSGMQRRLLGKILNSVQAGPVSSIFQFWSPFGYGGSVNQIGTNVDYSIWLSSKQDLSTAIPPLVLPPLDLPTPQNYDYPYGPIAPSPNGSSNKGRHPDPSYPDINQGAPPISGAYTSYTGGSLLSYLTSNTANANPICDTGSIPGTTYTRGVYVCGNYYCNNTPYSYTPSDLSSSSVGSFGLNPGISLGYQFEGKLTSTFVNPGGFDPATMYAIIVGSLIVQSSYALGTPPTYTTTPFWFNYSGYNKRTHNSIFTLDTPTPALSPSVHGFDGFYNVEQWDGKYLLTEVRIYAPGYVIH